MPGYIHTAFRYVVCKNPPPIHSILNYANLRKAMLHAPRLKPTDNACLHDAIFITYVAGYLTHIATLHVPTPRRFSDKSVFLISTRIARSFTMADTTFRLPRYGIATTGIWHICFWDLVWPGLTRQKDVG